MGDHNAVEPGTLGDERVDPRRDRKPVAGADAVALQHVVRDRRDVRDLRKLRGARQQLVDGEHLLAVDIAHELETVAADGRDRPAGADDRYRGLARRSHRTLGLEPGRSVVGRTRRMAGITPRAAIRTCRCPMRLAAGAMRAHTPRVRPPSTRRF